MKINKKKFNNNNRIDITHGWNTANVGAEHQSINQFDVKLMVMIFSRNHSLLHGKMVGVEYMDDNM